MLRPIALALSACVATCLASVTPAPAVAADINVVAPEAVTVRISFADLNLANADGRATLDRRIAGAARSLCGDFFHNDLQAAALVQTCRADAIASARLPAAYAMNDGRRDLTVTANRMSRAAN